MVAVSVWVKLGGNETVDIKFDANGVSSFAGDVASFSDANLHEMFGLTLAGLFPHGMKPREFVFPSFECFEWREAGIFCEHLGGRSIASGD